MADDTRDLELFGGLHVECSIEAHLKVSLVVLLECPQEALLENSSHEGVGDDHEPVGRVWQRLHLKQTNLVKAASVDVDSMSVC